jgi:hypothetical protein
MASLNFQYTGDESTLNDNSFDRAPLPDGEYNVVINDADYRETKNGNGYYVSVEFQVYEGEHDGRKLWANYNLVNPNPKAQEIGEQQFAKLCLAALGKLSCSDTDELIAKAVTVGVGLEKNDPTRNRIKYANPIGTVKAPTAKPAPAAASAAVGAAKKPWQK